jgi:hypothetical protein
MLLVEKRFQDFTPKAIADAREVSEVLVTLSADSREAVTRIVETAFAAGARRYREPETATSGSTSGWIRRRCRKRRTPPRSPEAGAPAAA